VLGMPCRRRGAVGFDVSGRVQVQAWLYRLVPRSGLHRMCVWVFQSIRRQQRMRGVSTRSHWQRCRSQNFNRFVYGLSCQYIRRRPCTMPALHAQQSVSSAEHVMDQLHMQPRLPGRLRGVCRVRNWSVQELDRRWFVPILRAREIRKCHGRDVARLVYRLSPVQRAVHAAPVHF
jgi:hypothetical protein